MKFDEIKKCFETFKTCDGSKTLFVFVGFSSVAPKIPPVFVISRCYRNSGMDDLISFSRLANMMF